jgi:uncharacterized membrane protein YccC
LGWRSVCALVATLLRNFASYVAALAAYTAAIIASDQLGAAGGLNSEAFAITRVSQIWITTSGMPTARLSVGPDAYAPANPS